MKTFTIGLIAFILFMMAGIVSFSVYVGWRLLHPPRKPIDMLPENYGISSYKEIDFDSREEGISLCGWYMSASDNGYPSKQSTIIFAHGYTQNRLEPHLPALSLADQLLRAGYDILLFDFRNAGESGGHRTTIGYYEQRDLMGAVDYVTQHAPGHLIGLIGFSMGAATSLLVAGQDQRVKVVVADSSFSCLYSYLQEKMTDWTNLPRFPFNSIILTILPLLSGANPRKVKPLEAIQLITPRPVLLIHGTGDETIPHHHSQRLHQAAMNPKTELWTIPGTGHVRSYAANPEQYTTRLLEFLNRNLDRPKTP
ncbi:alpha/beta hydrolase [Brevibacillus ginsengisoli]|uniref:alpha/beta hydrolase n=1 Tax=Brevibacillus ginsengisoli TaxID=363854 RepID=UPI003CEB4157